MNPQEAFAIVSEASGAVAADRATHTRIVAALNTLKPLVDAAADGNTVAELSPAFD